MPIWWRPYHASEDVSTLGARPCRLVVAGLSPDPPDRPGEPRVGAVRTGTRAERDLGHRSIAVQSSPTSGRSRKAGGLERLMAVVKHPHADRSAIADRHDEKDLARNPRRRGPPSPDGRPVPRRR